MCFRIFLKFVWVFFFSFSAQENSSFWFSRKLFRTIVSFLFGNLSFDDNHFLRHNYLLLYVIWVLRLWRVARWYFDSCFFTCSISYFFWIMMIDKNHWMDRDQFILSQWSICLLYVLYYHDSDDLCTSSIPHPLRESLCQIIWTEIVLRSLAVVSSMHLRLRKIGEQDDADLTTKLYSKHRNGQLIPTEFFQHFISLNDENDGHLLETFYSVHE